jgi:hypothetical protein
VKELAGDLPGSFSLEQNFPNPFNPATTIRFSLPRSSEVTLKVYDTLGKEVAILLNQKFAAGDHEIKWNAGALSSGIYLYRLQANGVVDGRIYS